MRDLQSYGVSTAGGFRFAGDTIQTGYDLRGKVEIGIRGRLPDTIFKMGAGIPGTADHPDHGTAIVPRPHNLIGCERVRPVTLVTIDCGRREQTGCACVLKQSRDVLTPARRQQLALIARHEGVFSSVCIQQRLVQMPAT